jgi:hypothetical protein
MPGKRVQFDQETWNALDLLAKDRMQDFQELAGEAFADLLRKHGRTAGTTSAECFLPTRPTKHPGWRIPLIALSILRG